MRRMILIAAILLAAVPARADDAADKAACIKRLGDATTLEKREAACKRLIASGRYAGRDLSIIWTNLGSTYWSAKSFERAIEAHSTAIKADPGNARAWQSRGVNYWELKRYGRALSDLDRAIRIAPRHHVALGNRCSLYEELNAFRRAVRDCRRSIRIKAEDWNTNNLAWTLYRMGRPKQGLYWANRAVALGPRDASSHDTRGHIQAALGNRKAAISDFRRAIELSKSKRTTESSRKGLAKLGVEP